MQTCSKIQERLQTNCRKLPGGGLPSAPVHPPSWGAEHAPALHIIHKLYESHVITPLHIIHKLYESHVYTPLHIIHKLYESHVTTPLHIIHKLYESHVYTLYISYTNCMKGLCMAGPINNCFHRSCRHLDSF